MSQSQSPIDINDFVAAIRELSNEQLGIVKDRLQNAVAQLEQSNQLMGDLARNKADPEEFEPPTEEDIVLYKESIEDNKKVIDNQQLRLTAIDLEQTRRGIGNTEVAEKKEEEPNSVVL